MVVLKLCLELAAVGGGVQVYAGAVGMDDANSFRDNRSLSDLGVWLCNFQVVCSFFCNGLQIDWKWVKLFIDNGDVIVRSSLSADAMTTGNVNNQVGLARAIYWNIR